VNWAPAAAGTVRATIARAWLGSRGSETLGSIVLRPHQRAAAARLRALIAAHGGAMLADPVGLGKTYAALSAARSAKALVVVAPAALRGMWADALHRTGIRGSFISYEALSRGRTPPVDADFVIADEAHHVRNPATRRYRALADLSSRATLLLLSATPVHNRLDDLRALLALFLGQRARHLDAGALAEYVVKREADDIASTDRAGSVPRVAAPEWLEIGDDQRVLRGIMRLPPPVSAADGGDGGVLVAMSLVRQWASSRAALESALRTRLAQADALLSAFSGDRYPTRSQLRAWCYSEGAMQLAFPQIASDQLMPDDLTLVDDLGLHRDAVESLLRDVRRAPDPDDARAAALLDVMHRHAQSQIVVFAEFAATVKTLYRRLLPLGGVAMLSGRGGFVAGGRVTRRELLAQFAPGGAERVSPARRVRVLITTDLFSEGVNLHAADVVVHADLPWTPARCEQRIGRIRRLGSPHAEVFVYAMRPPAGADRLLRIEARLRRKIRAAGRAIGIRGAIMPRLFSAPLAEAPKSIGLHARLSRLLERWLEPVACGAGGSALVAAVPSRHPGFIAAVDAGTETTLVTGSPGAITDDLEWVLDAVDRAGAAGAVIPPLVAEQALLRVREWCQERRSMELFDSAALGPAVARRRLLRRIDAIASRSPRHLRSRYAPLAREARRAASLTFGAGSEKVLAELATARMPDEAWLTAVRMFARLHARSDSDGPVRVRALLLLVAASSATVAGPP
jgi:Helicase conserved C-terminal domain/SNF2-related domain